MRLLPPLTINWNLVLQVGYCLFQVGYSIITVDRYWLKSALRQHTDELRLLKNVIVTNTSNEVDTEDTLEPGKDDKDEDYVPEIKKGKCDMFSKYIGGNSDSIPEEF